MATGGPKPWSTFGKVVSVSESEVVVKLESTSDLKEGTNVLLVALPPAVEHNPGSYSDPASS